MTKATVLFRLLMILLAFSPVITALISWDLDGKLDEAQYAIRHHSIPVLTLEVGLILLAATSGMRPAKIMRSLQRWQKAALCAVVIAAVLSANAVGLYQREAWLATLVWIVHLFFGFSIWFLATKSDVGTHGYFWTALVSATLTYAALTVVFAFLVPDSAGFPWSLRMPGVTNIRHTGYFVAPAIAVTTAFVFTSTYPRYLTLLALFLLGTFAFWSGSKGIFFSLLVAAMLAICVYPAFRQLRIWCVALGVLALGAVFSMALPAPNPEFGFFNRIKQLTSQEHPDLSTGRTTVWRESINEIQKKPVLGHAAGLFRIVMHKKIGPYNHAHNFFLQILFQWGLIGAIGFFSLIFHGYWRCIVAAGKDLANAPSLAVITTLLAYSLIDGAGYYPFPVSIMLFAAAFLFVADKNTSRSAIHPTSPRF